jgi:fucose permease
VGFHDGVHDILIPRFKEAFTLDYFQAMLVQLVFCGACFVGSLLYFVISVATGDPIARMAVGLFTSVGWSNTFSLAIEGVGSYKSQASSLLVMAILGGAILPPIQGFVADRLRLQVFFIVPLVAYAHVAFYGWKGHEIGRNKPAT